jgi:hypothetical protein
MKSWKLRFGLDGVDRENENFDDSSHINHDRCRLNV